MLAAFEGVLAGYYAGMGGRHTGTSCTQSVLRRPRASLQHADVTLNTNFMKERIECGACSRGFSLIRIPALGGRFLLDLQAMTPDSS